MPFVRISMIRGKPESYIRAIGDGLHRALVAEYDVPEHDRFQIVHQHEPYELSFDAIYLAGPRTQDFVLVAVTAGRPRTAEMRYAFFKRAAKELQRDPGLDPKNLMIVINTTQPEEWSFGDGVAQMASLALRARVSEATDGQA
jgi:phenylpyruvate tautomerase PptA (4-oxalocrotonate tautomerase family)